MYRILINKPNMPKDSWQFYKITNSEIDPETQEVVKTTSIYECNSLEDLAEKYTELLQNATAATVIPVDMLKVEMNVEITDETTE